MRPVKDLRLFFALWPDEAVRHQVAENLKRFNIDGDKSRLVRNSNLHITLHFIGNTSLDEMVCLDRQASEVSARAFNLMIDYAGHFKKPKILWFACRRIPEPLYDLHRTLGQQISHCDFESEQRHYSPHVTVARKIDAESSYLPLEPVLWKVDRFVLIKSVPISAGVRYEVINSYLLN